MTCQHGLQQEWERRAMQAGGHDVFPMRDLAPESMCDHSFAEAVVMTKRLHDLHRFACLVDRFCGAMQLLSPGEAQAPFQRVIQLWMLIRPAE